MRRLNSVSKPIAIDLHQSSGAEALAALASPSSRLSLARAVGCEIAAGGLVEESRQGVRCFNGEEVRLGKAFFSKHQLANKIFGYDRGAPF